MKTVKRVRMEVYCLAEDAAAVADSMSSFFANHDVGLWMPHGPRIDNGNARDAKAAKEFHLDGWDPSVTGCECGTADTGAPGHSETITETA